MASQGRRHRVLQRLRNPFDTRGHAGTVPKYYDAAQQIRRVEAPVLSRERPQRQRPGPAGQFQLDASHRDYTEGPVIDLAVNSFQGDTR